MSIEEAISIYISNAECLEKDGCLISASEARQLASWLQELKERREKESRQIQQDMTEEACEAFINLTEKVIEILPDLIETVIANMPKAIELYIESKGGKES